MTEQEELERIAKAKKLSAAFEFICSFPLFSDLDQLKPAKIGIKHDLNWVRKNTNQPFGVKHLYRSLERIMKSPYYRELVKDPTVQRYDLAGNAVPRGETEAAYAESMRYQQEKGNDYNLHNKEQKICNM